MKRFVFRAQVALDLRLKQEDEAKRLVAIAQQKVLDARHALDAACRQLDEGIAKGRDADAAGDLVVGMWYRNWSIGQRQRIEQCRRVLKTQESLLDEARTLAVLARRKAKSLERFRDRAWQRHTCEEARQEQKQLDEHGALRFALGPGRGGTNT